MRNLVKYFIRYSISGNTLMVLILLFGVIGMLNMRSTFFPQTPVRNIMVNVVYPGASPEEIEEGIVLKIEDQLTGVSGIERVTSTSMENTGNLNVELKRGADPDEVLQDVKNAVDQIGSFPVDMEEPEIYKLEQKSVAISFAVVGSKDLKALKKSAREVERDLLAIEGISKVKLSGFPDEEISIEFDENSLKRYNLTMAQVMDAVQKSNLDITGGTIKGEQEEFRIRLKNKAYFGKNLKDIVVRASNDGRIVRLSDVAKVKDTWADAPEQNFINGEMAVAIDIKYTNDEDLIGIVEDVREYIDAYNDENSVLELQVIDDRSKVVRDRIDMLVDNGVLGFIIVFLLLAIILHYRLAFWVALSIPISFGGMFVLSNFFDVTLNVISLFGMITVIGILVDDGVVISENIYQHHEKGKNRIRAAIDGTIEVVPAVFSAILTTIIVFSTFFFIDGRLGDFFGEMAFVVIATLIFSLVEGVFILPAHVAHSKALDKNAKKNMLVRGSTKAMDWLKYKLYEPTLSFAMRNKLFALAIPIGIMMITMGAMKGGIIATTFFPEIEREEISINLKMPAGTRDHITAGHLLTVEDAVWEVNDVLKDSFNTDQDFVLFIDKRIGPVDPSKGLLNVKLLSAEEREIKQKAIADMIRERVGGIPGAEEFSFGTGNPFGRPISIALRGDSLNEIRSAVIDLKNEMGKLSDLRDITDNDPIGTKEVVIKLTSKAYQLGLKELDIMRQIRMGFFGGEIQRVQRGLDEVKVWVRYDEDYRSSIKQLKDVQIVTEPGGKYYLRDLVEFKETRGVIAINHTNGRREIEVGADLGGESTAPVMISNIEENILPKIMEKYPSLDYAFEGQFREQSKSMTSMMTVVPVILILMVSVIVLTFRSFGQTLIVLLLLPFAFIGVAWGHWLHGMNISLFSFLGMIALVGIIVNDSLVFVGQLNTNLKARMPFEQALKDASVSRFRPILLTSITTIAGLAPLIFEKSFQAQFLIPMALTIAYGLAFATLILLILLPVLLHSKNSLLRIAHWYWYDERVDAVEVEPAYKELKQSEAHEEHGQ